MHLPVAYDETPRQIMICNDDNKFATLSHNILQEFAVNEMIGMFHHDIVMTLHNQRTCSYRVLKWNAFITYELDISWDPGISLTFSEDVSIWSAAFVFLHLPSPTTDLSQKSVSPLPSWFSFDVHLLGLHPSP